MSSPSIVRLPSPIGCGFRYRITGAPTSPAWASTVRPGREPWCEITTWDHVTLGSYGGELWPMAWPELFENLPNSNHGTGGVRLTEAGRAALEAADELERLEALRSHLRTLAGGDT